MSNEPLDLLHCGDERRIGAYLVETDDGLALFDCGPTSCLAALHDALGRRGVESLIEHPARMTHASTATGPFAAPTNLVRLSVGIESADDLVTDLQSALAATPARA